MTPEDWRGEQDARALDALFLAVAGPSGAVRLEWLEDGGVQRAAVACHDLPRFRRLCGDLGARYDVWAGVQPRAADGGLTARCNVLWCVAESGRAGAALMRLRPRPTLLLREGDTVRMTALWALSEGLTWDWTVRANRRLAHAIGGPKKYAEPEHVVRVPGSFVRDRLVALPVRSVLEPTALYRPRDVVSHLDDAPDPDAWRKRKDVAA